MESRKVDRQGEKWEVIFSFKDLQLKELVFGEHNRNASEQFKEAVVFSHTIMCPRGECDDFTVIESGRSVCLDGLQSIVYGYASLL